MENYSVVIFLLALLVSLSAFAYKIKIPYPVLLIVVGIAVGFIPDLPEVKINPEVIFLIFLPPLLFDAAYKIPIDGFKTHFHTIGTLAVSLVLMTTCGIAVVAYYCIPGMTWPLAFVLGSILSATDAVAAISITQGLGLSHKTTTILEGESLVNDASALVCYHFAVAAVAGSAFSVLQASWQFLILMVGGIGVGLVISRLFSYMLVKFQSNHNVSTSLIILMPFVTYLIAEEIHVSGVIAVVIVGLGLSRFTNKLMTEEVKKQSQNIWNVVIFLLNGLIFILIGMQFPYEMKAIPAEEIYILIGYAFLITLTALLIRTLIVFMQQSNLLRAYNKMKSYTGKRPKITEHALLDFKTSLIISWSGMRGIVSLAIAIALPAYLSHAKEFPMREPIIFISIAVVLFTIIGQGLTLPWLVKSLNVNPKEIEV